ncbi:hypothetical protein LINPERPRIM_LOCUS6464 [Linum perenne]
MKESKSAKLISEQLLQQPSQHSNGQLSPSKFAKFYCLNFVDDQLGDVLHWIWKVVALLCGLVWGSIPLVGGIWIPTLFWTLCFFCSCFTSASCLQSA